MKYNRMIILQKLKTTSAISNTRFIGYLILNLAAGLLPLCVVIIAPTYFYKNFVYLIYFAIGLIMQTLMDKYCVKNQVETLNQHQEETLNQLWLPWWERLKYKSGSVKQINKTLTNSYFNFVFKLAGSFSLTVCTIDLLFHFVFR